MALTTRFKLTVDADLSTALDLSTSASPLAIARNYVLASGTGVGQADKIFHDRRTLAASATEDLDLQGSLLDPLNATVTFARIKGFILAADSANTNNVVVGNVTNGIVAWFGAATHTIAVRPGGVFSILATDATSYAVTAGTADLVHIANSGAGTSVTYDIVIIGASA